MSIIRSTAINPEDDIELGDVELGGVSPPTATTVIDGRRLQEETVERDPFWGQICIIAVFIMFVCMICALPVVAIIYACLNWNDMQCPNNVVQPNIWLVVQSVVNIIWFYILALMIWAAMKKDKISTFCLIMANMFILTFNIVWIIIGSVMFWNNCAYHIPPSPRAITAVYLIFGYMSILAAIRNRKNE